MPNHVHGIVMIHETMRKSARPIVGARHASPLPPRGTPPGSLGAIIGSFKSSVTRHAGRELTCRAGIQPASAVSGSWEPDNSGNIWQRNYVSRVLCGVTNTSSGTSAITNASQITSPPTRSIGRTTKKTRIGYNRSHERAAPLAN
jgi:hypothetical protein